MYLAALLILALTCPSISYAAPSELEYKKIQEKIDKRQPSAAEVWAEDLKAKAPAKAS